MDNFRRVHGWDDPNLQLWDSVDNFLGRMALICSFGAVWIFHWWEKPNLQLWDSVETSVVRGVTATLGQCG